MGRGVQGRKEKLAPHPRDHCSSCLPGAVMLVPAVEDPSAAEDPSPAYIPEIISVTLKVSSVLPPYKQTFFILSGSSLEDVLKMAQNIGGFT